MEDIVVEMLLNIKLLVLSISSFICVILILYFIIKGKKAPLTYSFIGFQVLVLIWLTGHFFESLAIYRESKWFFVKFQYSAICFIGFDWLLFSLYYSNHPFVKKKNNLLLLLIIPIICYGTVLTNEHHGYFYRVFEATFRKYGIAFWINNSSTDAMLKDSSVFALSYMMSKDALVSIIKSESVDRELKAFSIEQNYHVIKEILEDASCNENDIEFVIEAMEILPIVDLHDSLQNVQETIKTPELKNRCSIVLNNMQINGIKATQKWVD